MRYLLNVFLILNSLFILSTSAQAAKLINANKTSKERLVLMPLRVGDADKSRQAAMETALVEGLQHKYEVFFGEQVSQKAKVIFLKESRNTRKKECDETRCMQDIAEAFQAELIATANVSKQEDGYFLALSIQNIFDNKVVYSKSIPCKNCDAYQVVDRLKELSSVPISSSKVNELFPQNITANKSDPETIIWNEVEMANTQEDYQTYINNYPKGRYIAFAKTRLEKLKEETALWSKAESSNYKIALETYLKIYPNGRYQELANAKLKFIKEGETNGLVMVSIPGKNYEIGKFEVTQAMWKDVMLVNPTKFPNCGDKCPIDSVSWNDIQDYIQKLNSITGKQYRLPTRAEWEYACYGGFKTEYCGGNDINAVAWYKKNSSDVTHAVGQKQANGYGLYDMTGNVSELLSDCNDEGCTKHSHRGGTFYSEDLFSRTDERGGGAYSAVRSSNKGHGFRLARTLP